LRLREIQAGDVLGGEDAILLIATRLRALK
jgi:hypothetical protein